MLNEKIDLKRIIRILTLIAWASALGSGLTSCTPTGPPSANEPSDLILFPPYALAFGSVQAGKIVNAPLSISNIGNQPITINQIMSNHRAFVPTPTGFTLAVGAVQNITIQFSPTTTGEALGFLEIQTDDPSQNRTIALGGMGTKDVIAIESRIFSTLSLTNSGFGSGENLPSIRIPLGVVAVGRDTSGNLFTEEPQTIGIYLKNTSDTTLRNVRAKISFPFYSGISSVRDIEEYGEMRPGIPVLGFFTANFVGSTPGLYDVHLTISADGGFASQVARKLFVMDVEIDPSDWSQGPPDKLIAKTPGGTLTRVTHSYLEPHTAPGHNALVPLTLTETLIPSSSYSGQVSPPPFPDDAPWKGVGAGLAFVGTIAWAWSEDKTMQGVAGTMAAIGGAVAFFDGQDAFRRGQLNTVPFANELTIKETVEAKIEYIGPKIYIGEPFTAKVNWTYTRFLDSNRKLTHTVSEIARNDRIVTSRNISVNKNSLVVGDDLIISAQFQGCCGRQFIGMDAYVFAGISTSGDSFIDKTLLLRDNGQGGDSTAHDGIYTGILPIIANANRGTWNIFVFAQDTNRSPQSSDITVLPYFIGGIGLSFPASDGQTIQPDRVVTIQ